VYLVPRSILLLACMLVVERGGQGIRDTYSFIKEQERRVFKNQPRNRKSLFLSPRNHHAALPDHCIVSIREAVDAIVDMCAARCFMDLFHRGVEVAVVDVVADGVVEKGCVLWHDADGAS
jgi:hypothetical protein